MDSALLEVLKGVVFAAFCIWLARRIVKRRERWAIAVAFLAVAALMIFLIWHSKQPVPLKSIPYK